MKTTELIKLIDTGVCPVIKFTSKINELDTADPGMMGRIVGYHTKDEWEPGTVTIEFKIDLSEFVNINKKIAVPDWGDNKVTWFESKFYPSNHIIDICEMLMEKNEESEFLLFEVIEDTQFISEFKNQIITESYSVFLENKLKKITETEHFDKFRKMGFSSEQCSVISDYIKNLI